MKITETENCKVYFTSDQHINHKNIIKFASRPFDHIDVMNQTIVDNLNAIVRPTDILFSLGDYIWNDSVKSFKDQLNCKNIYSCIGNHDSEQDLIKTFGRDRVRDIWDIKVNGQAIVLCHYRLDIWNKSHYGAWHLWGHSHTLRTAPTAHDDNNHKMSCDVGVDYWDFKPVSIEDLTKHFEFKKKMILKRLGMETAEWIAE